MKTRNRLGIFALTCFLAPSLLSGQVYNTTETFDSALTLSPVQAPNAWYPDTDLYTPEEFDTFFLTPDDVLRIRIDGANDDIASRVAPFNVSSYNNQGRKLDLPVGSYALRSSLYIPAGWNTDHRRSDLGGTLTNGVGTETGSPVIGYANVDGSSPVIRYWDGSAWVNTAVSVTETNWYDLEMVLVGDDVVYRVDGVDVATVAFTGSTKFQDVFLQAYNFNDSSLPVAEQSSDSYEAYWEDLEIASTPVLNVTTTTPYATIQAAITAATNGDTIAVFEGTFTEDLTIDKDLTMEGPNAGVNAVSGSRGTEAIISGQVSVTSDGVTLDGFTLTDPTGNIAVFSNDVGDLDITNNKITGVNDTGTAGFAVGVYIRAQSSAVSNFTITNNRIDAIGGPSTNQAVQAIYVGQPAESTTISNITITGNRIDDVESGTTGAYGVHIDHGVTSTGTVSGVSITSNTFSGIEGDFVHAIGFETETGAATVTGNEIFNLTANGGANEAVGVFFHDNPIGGPASNISQNLFRNSMSAGVQVHTSDVYVVDATENFWDASNGPSGINGSTAVGSGTPVSNNVLYSPWYAEAGRVNLVTLASFTNFTVIAGDTRTETGNLYIGAGAVATVRGTLDVQGRLILEDGGSLVVIDGNLEMGNASTVSGTFTIFNSFGSWNINGSTIFNMSQSLALVTDIHVAAGATVGVEGNGELILDGCVIDSQTPGSPYNIIAATNGLLTIARCDVTDAVIDIDSTSAGSKVYDSYFTDSSIEASSASAVYHNMFLSGVTSNVDATTAFDPVDGWSNVSAVVDLENLFTLDLDISALPNRTLDSSDETVYVQPADALVGDINVSELSAKINSVEVMLGYATDFYDASSIALETDWNVDLNTLEDDTGAVGKLDSAIGIRFDFPDAAGTDADDTIGKVTLTGQGVEGQTQFFHRVKLPSDAFAGETRFTTGGPSPVYLTPFTVNSGLIVIDGTAPVIAVGSADGTQVHNPLLSPVDVLDPNPAGAPHVAFRNGNDMIITFTASDAGGSGLDTTDLANDFTFSASDGTTTLNTFTLGTSEAAGVVTYTVTLEIPVTATNGTYDVTATVTDRSGNVSAVTDLGEFVLANELHTNVELEGFTGGTRDVTFVATDSVGGFLATWTETVTFTGALGSVSLDNVPDLTTNLSAKTNWNLRSNIPVSFSGTGVGSANFTGTDLLPGGDVNGDNAVNTLDYSILRFYWLLTDPTADIDGSGAVNLTDYNILRANFYTSGDAE